MKPQELLEMMRGIEHLKAYMLGPEDGIFQIEFRFLPQFHRRMTVKDFTGFVNNVCRRAHGAVFIASSYEEFALGSMCVKINPILRTYTPKRERDNIDYILNEAFVRTSPAETAESPAT